MGRKQEQMITQATANYYHENVVVSQMMKDALETSVEKVARKDVPKKKKMKWYKKLLKKARTRFSPMRT